MEKQLQKMKKIQARYQQRMESLKDRTKYLEKEFGIKVDDQPYQLESELTQRSEANGERKRGRPADFFSFADG